MVTEEEKQAARRWTSTPNSHAEDEHENKVAAKCAAPDDKRVDETTSLHDNEENVGKK